MTALRWALSSAATLLLIAAAGASHAGCAAPSELSRFHVTLSHTARVIRSGKELAIVAIGSSSTRGIGASDPAHTYPAVLARELRSRWPRHTVTMFNQGVPGEMALQTLARFERDVVSYHPQLVIWQTGSNEALRSATIDGYREILREGIQRLKSAGADVVLMDPQFSPRILARPLHPFVVDSIAEVAKETKVALFPRFALMRRWLSGGSYHPEDVISRDGLHMNDMSYGYIGCVLADSVVAAAVSPVGEPAAE